jgi:signal transduction histidine kinase/ligand-binding sensor domain-containing protein
LVVLAGALPVHAAGDDSIGVERVRFRNIGVAQGLSQASGLDIVQGARGFIWIATQDGLDRYDGYGFRVYKHDRSDPWSLAANNLHRLMVDRQGRLWVGTTSGGLSRYDAQLDRFDNFRPDPNRSDALGGEYVSTLLQDKAGTIWVGTRNHGLQQYEEAGAHFVESRCRGVALAHLLTMLELDDGGLLLGTNTGAFRCDPASGALTEWMSQSGIHLAGRSLAKTAAGDVWMSATKQGLYRFRGDGTEIEHFDAQSVPALADTDITGLLIDRGGSVWTGSENAGLSRLNPQTRRLDIFRHASEQPGSLAGNRAFSLFEDRDGQIWVGTWSNGVSVFDPRAAGFVSVHPGGAPRALPGASVLSVFADNDGTFWFSTAENGGLSHFDLDRGLLQRYTHHPQHADSLAHNFVASTVRGPDGSLWVATRGGGLDRLRQGASGFEHHRHDPADPRSIASDSLMRLYFDRAGTLWVGTLEDGVDALCAGCDAFRHYRHTDSVPDSLALGGVFAMLQTRDGAMWIGSDRSGLDLLDPGSGRAQHFVSDQGNPASLSANTVTDLHEDRHGGLWIGTRGGGLCHLLQHDASGGRFEEIDSLSGLAADAIGGIAEDEEERLWLSTTVGISRYDPRDRSVVNLGADQGASTSGYFIAAVDKAHDGRVVFGGAAVATIFDPEQVPALPVPEPVLTQLRLFNTPVVPRWRDPQSPLEQTPWSGGRVVLTYLQSMLSINYGAPAAFAPASLKFAYRLEPHDAAWIETDASLRTATYTHLAPGDYRLRVRARYPGQPWSTQEASIALTVLPAPWWSAWAKFGYTLLAACAAVLAWRRVRKNRQEREAVQDTVRQSEERLKLALWSSGAELWDVDLSSGTLRRDNQLDHLAASHETVEQTFQGYRPFMHAEDVGGFEDALRNHVKGNTPVFEASYRTPNRQHDWVWILTRGRVVQHDAKGRALRMTGTNTDINALKQAESALRLLNEQLETRVERRTEALQSANIELRRTLERLTIAQRQLLEAEKLASLGGMVAGIAHEINTPLGIGVTASSHLYEEARRMSRLIDSDQLRRSDLEQFQRTACESSDLILRNLQRADRLVKSFKQVAVDQSSEDRRVIDLGSSLNEILTTLGPTLKKTPHRIELHCPPGLIVETAPGALYQIITNLVMNSTLHGLDQATGGCIRIEASRQEGDIAIDYADDGRGMEEAVRARVFEPFFTTRRGQGGSGLGMHIVYSLVTQVLHGSIVCESEPGQGARFHIRFNPGAIPPRA